MHLQSDLFVFWLLHKNAKEAEAAGIKRSKVRFFLPSFFFSEETVEMKSEKQRKLERSGRIPLLFAKLFLL
ncbi:MAG: hypothetical protein IJK01_04085 [Clostridia bacterium]|nr:hypothetical protein [Clostridia bacterium]